MQDSEIRQNLNPSISKGQALAFFLVGFAPLTAQILLLRELLVVAYGNELSVGIMLGAWLLWTALGSLVLGPLSDRIQQKQRLVAFIQAGLSLLLPLSIAGVRSSRWMFGLPGGEVVDLTHMILITCVAVGPFCVVSGFLFALCCGLHNDVTRKKDRSVGRIFFLEALGSAVAGLALTTVFFHFLNHFQAAFVVSLLLILSALALGPPAKGLSSRGLMGLLILLGVLFALLFHKGSALDHLTRQWQWPHQNLLASRDSPYGNLTVVSLQEQITFFENGLWLFSHPDPQSAEQSVHFALLQHEAPERVLLVGGGISGSLAEVLKHPSVLQVDYVELDPAILELGRQTLPRDGVQFLDDPRVRVIHEDGRRYVKMASTEYDVIVVDFPDPLTAQLNRFYTSEFFEEARNILGPWGVFAISLNSTEAMVGPTLARLLGSVQKTLHAVFPDVLVYPGATARFLASPNPGRLVKDPRVLVDRIRDRNLHLQYVQGYYILFHLSPQKLQFLQQILHVTKNTHINRDLSPTLYVDTLAHWGAQYSPRMAILLDWAKQIHFKGVLFSAAGLILGFLLLSRLKSPRTGSRNVLLYACFMSGYTEMTLSVLLIIAFQILYGSLYYKMAVLIMAYMLGLMAGSHWITPRLEKRTHLPGVLGLIQGGLAVYSLGLWGILVFIHGMPALPWAWLETLCEWGFSLLLFVAGVLGGLHFPVSGSLYLSQGHPTGQTAGVIYALDLAGSALGALSAVLLLPGLGFGQTLVLLTLLNLLAAATLPLIHGPPVSIRTS